MTEKTEPLFAGPDDDGKRLDRVLRRYFPRLALSGVYRLIRRGRVKVNLEPVPHDYRLKPGDRIDVAADLAALTREAAVGRAAPRSEGRRRLAALVLFENEHVLALNKPYGALVHGPDSLGELVAAGYGGAADSLSFRPGPAHRLDRNTSGVLLFGLSLFGARALARSFHARRVVKVYCALVEGEIRRAEQWEDLLERDDGRRVTVRARPGAAQARAACTRVVPVVPGKRFSLVLFLPATGRTHQLRFQAARRGRPLAGDVKYGGAADRPRYLLHSLGLAVRSEELDLPSFVAPLDRFGRSSIEELFGNAAVAAIYRQCREILE